MYSFLFLFISLFFKSKNTFFLQNNNFENLPDNDDNFININEMLKQFNNLNSTHLINSIINTPSKAEDILPDTFEHYLLSHFKIIKDFDDTITFERFYNWRKTIGTFYNKDELKQLFFSIIYPSNVCDIRQFIIINKIIDEKDGADLF